MDRALLTKREEFKPKVEHPIYKHGVYVNKENDRVHTGQLKVIYCLGDNTFDQRFLRIIDLCLTSIAGVACTCAKPLCSAEEDI